MEKQYRAIPVSALINYLWPQPSRVPDLTKRKKSYVKAQDTSLSVWYGDSKQT